MSGFVATAPPSPEPGNESDALANDGWFPDLLLSRIRESTRIDGTVTAGRLRDSALYAISTVNDQLAEYKARQLDAGKTSLAAVSDARLGDVERLVVLYRRAVCATISADLMERYRSFDSTGSAERRADDSDPAISEQMRNARWAVRDIQGQTHCTVELI